MLFNETFFLQNRDDKVQTVGLQSIRCRNTGFFIAANLLKEDVKVLADVIRIHADGLLKNEEIYNIFDTEKFLNRPVLCAVSNTSGLAGIAHWINTYFHLPEEKKLDKNCELVHEVKKWVDAEYESGRVTVLTDEELLKVIDDAGKKLGILLV